MCSGRPIVSNPVGEIKTLFERHAIGLLAEWDAEDFADKILQILDQPDSARRMAHCALQVARDEYDWKILIKKLEVFYTKVLSDSFAPNLTPKM